MVPPPAPPPEADKIVRSPFVWLNASLQDTKCRGNLQQFTVRVIACLCFRRAQATRPTNILIVGFPILQNVLAFVYKILVYLYVHIGHHHSLSIVGEASVCAANLERTHGCLRPPSPPAAVIYYLFFILFAFLLQSLRQNLRFCHLPLHKGGFCPFGVCVGVGISRLPRHSLCSFLAMTRV